MTTRTPVRSAHAAAFALLAALGLAGCGAAAPGLPPEQPVASTTEGSLAALDRAENDLMLALGGRVTTTATGAPAAGAPAQPGYAQPAPPPPPIMPDGERKQPATGVATAREADATVGAAASDPCSTACRALASMRRAADHLCQLSSETDDRCGSARQRVTSAGERVRSFCPMCSVAQE